MQSKSEDVYVGDRLSINFIHKDNKSSGEFKIEVVEKMSDKSGFIGRRKRDGKKLYVSVKQNEIGVDSFTGIEWLWDLDDFSIVEDF